MKSMLMMVLVSVLSIDGVGRAQSICPNQKATQVPARVQDYGPYRRCGLGVTVFGQTFGLAGKRCPKLRLITPAHQECRGAVNPGTLCIYEIQLSVRRQTCGCDFTSMIGTTGLDLVAGDCECRDDGNAGTVEDAMTATCQ